MSGTDDDAKARGGRRAVAGVFFVNGFLIGSWAPQIPVFMARLGVTPSTLGLLILLFGAGALIAMPVCGLLITRFDSRTITRFVSVCAAFGLPAVAVSPDTATAALALGLFGGFVGGMDVSMNANAVAVERRLGRAVMSSSHGFWSFGGFAGGALGGPAIALWGQAGHAVAVMAAALVIMPVVLPRLIAENSGAGAPGRLRLSLPRSPLVYLTGLVALLSMVPEGAVLDWAAVYLREERGAGIATAGFAFAAFSAAMASMRFLGDRVRNRLGAVATLRLSSLVAAVGMGAAGLAPWPLMAVAGFAFCGLGIANMVPIAFSAAGNQPGIGTGAGMSVATTIGYSGILVAPTLIGFAAERAGFATVFLALAAMPVLVFAMAGLVRRADTIASQPAE